METRNRTMKHCVWELVMYFIFIRRLNFLQELFAIALILLESERAPEPQPLGVSLSFSPARNTNCGGFNCVSTVSSPQSSRLTLCELPWRDIYCNHDSIVKLYSTRRSTDKFSMKSHGMWNQLLATILLGTKEIELINRFFLVFYCTWPIILLGYRLHFWLCRAKMIYIHIHNLDDRK